MDQMVQNRKGKIDVQIGHMDQMIQMDQICWNGRNGSDRSEESDESDKSDVSGSVLRVRELFISEVDLDHISFDQYKAWLKLH